MTITGRGVELTALDVITLEESMARYSVRGTYARRLPAGARRVPAASDRRQIEVLAFGRISPEGLRDDVVQREVLGTVIGRLLTESE